MLWPYRKSAIKNQQRWTFGGIYPETYARSCDDRCAAGFECLVRGARPVLAIELRFLQAVRRQVLVSGDPVEEATVDGQRLMSWDEATERTVALPLIAAGESRCVPIDVPAGDLAEAHGAVVVSRTWQRLRGIVQADVEPVAPAVWKLRVSIANTDTDTTTRRPEAVAHAMLSAHVVARTIDGDFVSAQNPPEELAEAASACAGDGLWPVLVGEEGTADTLFAAPIILYDHPRVAPESPGDFFDGCEIDQLLVLNILGMTDAERDEAGASDSRAREVIERTESMSPDELMRLHGVIRSRSAAS
jgi:hypothetical protein